LEEYQKNNEKKLEKLLHKEFNEIEGKNDQPLRNERFFYNMKNKSNKSSKKHF
jgi:hypothetical protein